MTNEEAHSAFLTQTKVKLNWVGYEGKPMQIIMIGFKRDMETIVMAVEDDMGDVRITSSKEIELANPDDWNPNAQTDRSH